MALEVTLAAVTGFVAFAVVAVTLMVVGDGVASVAVAVVCLAAIVAIAWLWGIVYAAPAAITSLLAFDWFAFPPTHAHAFPGGADLAELFAYVGVAVLIGELAAHAARRRAVSEAARAELLREQAALRRVATRVAHGEPPEAIFAACAEEAGVLLDVDGATIVRHDGGEDVVLLPGWSAAGYLSPRPGPATFADTPLSAEVLRTGRAARLDNYQDALDRVPDLVQRAGVQSGVGAPIVVDGQLWGVMLAWIVRPIPLPDTTEARLTDFTDLIATAISNSAGHEALSRLADEQAALRRVATLVATDPSPEDVFAAAAQEVARLVHCDEATLLRNEHDGSATLVAGGYPDAPIQLGERLRLDPNSVGGAVLRTGRPARVDFMSATTDVAASARERGIRSAVGVPIIVDGRVWGVVIANLCQPGPLPLDLEPRLEEFTALLATAISNAEARAEVAASRAREVAAAVDERRRVVRDLHDGAQQRLVHTVVTLKLALRALDKEQPDVKEIVAEALEHAETAHHALRELAHGIMPSVLARGGLRAAVNALASRVPVPVENGVDVGRLPAAIEATAYFVVAEALTNVAKHAGAEQAMVSASLDDGKLTVAIRDDGIGGARSDGSGLVGLADRVAALDGSLRVENPAGGGTLIVAGLPVTTP